MRGARSLTGLTYGAGRGYRPMVLNLHVPADAEGPVPVVVRIPDARLLGYAGVGKGRLDTRAAVLCYGPDRLDALAQDHVFGPAPFGEDPDMVRAMAPIEQVHDRIPTILLLHGDQDGIVGAEQSERLHAALLAVGVDSTLEITPDADHCFIGTPIQPHLDQAVGFLAGHLL